MTWTDQEWLGFCSLLEEGWPGTFDDSAADSWRVLLDATPPAAAVLALRRLLLQGGRFRPSVSELLAETRADPSLPTFAEAWVLIRRCLKAVRVRGAFGSESAMHRAEDDASLLMLAGAHPLVRSFVERQGVRRLKALPLDDPSWGEKTRRDLEVAWERHVEAFEGREVAGLASGDGDGMRRLDPLSSFGAAVPVLVEGEETR